MKLLEKLNTIMSKAGYIQKTGKHPQFKYASERDVKETLHPLFVENKVLLVPRGFSDVHVMQLPKEVEIADPKTGKITTTKTVSVLTTFVISWDWIDCETGETLTISTIGQGWDQADKGGNKGMTGSLKYAITLTLLIVTGEDAEADFSADEPKTQTVQKSTPSAQPQKENDTITKIRVDMADVGFLAGKIAEAVTFYNEHPDKAVALETINERIKKRKEKNNAATSNAV